MKISIIVPAHNEEDNITDIISNIEQAVSIEHELVIVNDHSTDRTKELVQGFMSKYSNLRLVENKSEKGFANALRTGFSNAGNELVVPVMADLCDELSTINQMYDKIGQGYDVVCGSRYMKGGGHIAGPKVKGFFSSLVGCSLHFLLKLPTHDISNAFKMYRKSVLDSLTLESQAYEISMEIPLKAYYAGFKVTQVPTVWRGRARGKSSFKIFKLLPNYLKLYVWAIIKAMRLK
jgi:dolichol-phosphate mannosyltransferase